MAIAKERTGGHGNKTAGCRGVPGLPNLEFIPGSWVVFHSEDHDGWIRGEVKRADRNMYGPNDYVIHFTERLSIQVM